MPSICSGSPGTLTPSASIKGAWSRGSEMIMIASARQPRSLEPRGERTSKRDKDARTICLCKALSARTLASRCLARFGHRVMSPLLPGAPAAPRLPASQHPEGPQGEKNGGGGGVDVIGADAAVSSIMDGDDADRGAKPALRRERNRNGERKVRGREIHSGARARARTHRHTDTDTRAHARERRASHCHSNTCRLVAHTQAHAHVLSP